jgi:hypothetical protein
VIQRSASAVEAARRLWALDAVGVSSPDDVAIAVGRICTRLGTGLARWIGAEGYRALLRRALDEERAAHPALGKLQCNGDNNAAIAAAVQAHGSDEVTAALVSLVAALVELLGRVVGEEMAVQLIVQAGAGRPSGVSSDDEKGGRDD